MRPHASDQFSYFGRRPNQFFLAELEEMLCPPASPKTIPRQVPLNFDASHKLENRAEDKRASFKFEKSADGKTLSLHIHIMRDNHTYDSKMTAVQVRKDNLFEIRELVFDNKPEKLSHRWEIASVLAFLGKNHLNTICQNRIPVQHKETGKFGKLGRFFSRSLADNPYTMPPPPY